MLSSELAVTREPEKLVVKIGERESVTSLVYFGSKSNHASTTVLLGHGAGANQNSAFMRMFAAGLAERGFDAMTFNFLYSEQARRIPDKNDRLESCYRAVITAAMKHKKLKANRLAIGGKSMGGRSASQVAAQDNKEAIAALIFLGYPLHPPGKPDRQRAEHLKNVRTPMLFVQGSRDAFGTPDELRAVIRKLRLPATLYVIEGGDHSLKVPKTSPLSQQEVYRSALDEIDRWLRSLGKNA